MLKIGQSAAKLLTQKKVQRSTTNHGVGSSDPKRETP
ncbi:MAG: hypothetical protein ACD_33C00041G0011 [uncultured bacterium]|nr:MAG: hypothetical protein ACD_33C00041G0011 [uncultured bacterium]